MEMNERKLRFEMNEMRLQFELIPEGRSKKNLRNALANEIWDVLRKQRYKYADNKCEICGEPDRLECHEIWGYQFDSDRNIHIQFLIGLIALCNMCHRVKHLNLEKSCEMDGPDAEPVPEEKLIAHFNKVNKCTGNDYNNHKSAALEERKELAVIIKDTYFGEYTKLVELFPKPITKNKYVFSCKLDIKT